MKTPHLLRFVVLAVAGATMVWLAGCNEASPPPAADGGPSPAEQFAERQAQIAAEKEVAMKKQAAAEQQRLADEGPSDITKSDFKRGSKLQGGSRVSQAIGGALRATENVQLQNIQHNLDIHGNGPDGYPESHQEFMTLIKQWGMKLPPLDGPYEYWYNAETHKIQKRPIVSKEGSDQK